MKKNYLSAILIGDADEAEAVERHQLVTVLAHVAAEVLAQSPHELFEGNGAVEEVGGVAFVEAGARGSATLAGAGRTERRPQVGVRPGGAEHQ